MRIKGIELYNAVFIEAPCQAQNHDILAEIALGTHLPGSGLIDNETISAESSARSA